MKELLTWKPPARVSPTGAPGEGLAPEVSLSSCLVSSGHHHSQQKQPHNNIILISWIRALGQSWHNPWGSCHYPHLWMKKLTVQSEWGDTPQLTVSQDTRSGRQDGPRPSFVPWYQAVETLEPGQRCGSLSLHLPSQGRAQDHSPGARRAWGARRTDVQRPELWALLPCRAAVRSHSFPSASVSPSVKRE